MKLLFITSSRIGDAILSTGVLNHLVCKHPGMDVTVAAAPLTLPLFDSVPGLTRLIPLHKQTFKRHWVNLWRQCRSEPWDMILDIRGSVVSYFLKASERYVWKSPKAREHRVIQLGRLIGASPVPPPFLWLEPAHLQKAHSLIGGNSPVLALAPAANWVGKQWPPSAFAHVLGQFVKKHEAKVAVFAAPQERASVQPVLDAIPENRRIDGVENLSLLEIAACLKQCQVFIGNDSGLMHMAAAVGTPTIGLFGPSDDQVYGPYCSQAPSIHWIIRTPESLEDLKKLPDFAFDAPRSFMGNLKPDTVFQALGEMWQPYAC